jgi:hypothetical protein
MQEFLERRGLRCCGRALYATASEYIAMHKSFLSSILFVLDRLPLTLAPFAGVQNRMCVHPKFLHSNATSHKWPFGGKLLCSFRLVSGVRSKRLSCTAFLHFVSLQLWQSYWTMRLMRYSAYSLFRCTLDHSGLDIRLNHVS